MIAALYVERGGAYWNLWGVDAWDEERDARLYDGPCPVVVTGGRGVSGEPLGSAD